MHKIYFRIPGFLNFVCNLLLFASTYFYYTRLITRLITNIICIVICQILFVRMSSSKIAGFQHDFESTLSNWKQEASQLGNSVCWEVCRAKLHLYNPRKPWMFVQTLNPINISRNSFHKCIIILMVLCLMAMKICLHNLRTQ